MDNTGVVKQTRKNIIFGTQCLPRTFLGIDILCQFSSDFSRMKVFILSEMTELVGGQASVLIITNARKQSLKISREYEWFSKWMHSDRVRIFCDGPSIKEDELIKELDHPTMVIGTPG